MAKIMRDGLSTLPECTPGSSVEFSPWKQKFFNPARQKLAWTNSNRRDKFEGTPWKSSYIYLIEIWVRTPKRPQFWARTQKLWIMCQIHSIGMQCDVNIIWFILCICGCICICMIQYPTTHVPSTIRQTSSAVPRWIDMIMSRRRHGPGRCWNEFNT